MYYLLSTCTECSVLVLDTLSHSRGSHLARTCPVLVLGRNSDRAPKFLIISRFPDPRKHPMYRYSDVPNQEEVATRAICQKA